MLPSTEAAGFPWYSLTYIHTKYWLGFLFAVQVAGTSTWQLLPSLSTKHSDGEGGGGQSEKPERWVGR